MMFVYDVTNRESFENIEGHYRDAVRYSQKTPCFLLGNKIDLKKERVVSPEEGQVRPNNTRLCV